MRIIIGGALGRMGRELRRAAEALGISVSQGVDAAYQGEEMPFPVAAGYGRFHGEADVLIDFSTPEALPDLLAFCQEGRLPAVLCATGYTDAEQKSIEEAARKLPILRSANMSLGINVLEQLVAVASKALGESFDIEIVEKHHRMKADGPSGTALMLYETARKELGGGVKQVRGWYGRTCVREKGDIGLHAVRGGTLAGEHEVGFYGENEQVLLTHRAESRAIFAQGALRAARFLLDKPPGSYTMRDVVLEMLQKGIATYGQE